jgi:hypothetical protein
MSTISKNSVEILKTVKDHPGISASEIGEHTRERPRLQRISALLKKNFLQVTGIGERPSSSGEPRMMNLYSITHRGSMILQRHRELLGAPKPKRPKVYVQLEEFRASKSHAGSVRPALEVTIHDNGCSVATGREAKRTYEKYVAPPPTGRGYVPRIIRNVANM